MMVQGIMELLFDAAYLIFALAVGIYLIVKGKGKFFKLFGVMAVVLSSGDSFHFQYHKYGRDIARERNSYLSIFLYRQCFRERKRDGARAPLG